MSALVPASPALLATELAALAEDAHGYAADASASSTRRIYQGKFRGFEGWRAGPQRVLAGSDFR